VNELQSKKNMKTVTNPSLSLERMILAASIVALGALLMAVAGVAFGVPYRIGLLVSLALGALAWRRIAARIPCQWDGLHRQHPVWCLIWLFVALAALTRTAGVAWFMADASHAGASVYWFDQFYTAHSCYSAYWQAAQLARARIMNLYDPAHYNFWIGRFEVDEFLYLPQFLILPRIGLALGGDFYQIRSVWFALEAGLFACTTFVLCRWIGGSLGSRAAVLLPALWLSSPILATLQVGNYQLAAISFAILAMVAIERDRPLIGGALLALACFKIWPALLLVYLVASRRWRAVGWTIAFSLLLCGVAWLWMGSHPFQAFSHFNWPRLRSRDAWPYLDDVDVSGMNDSVPGLVLKLKQVGVKGMTPVLEDYIQNGWTLIVVAFSLLAARLRPRLSPLERACTWVAILILASFGSPFLPDIYGLIPPMCLWWLLASSAKLTRRNILTLAFGWIAFSAVLPMRGTPLVGYPRMLVSTVSQVLAVGLCFWVLARHYFRPAHEADAVLEIGKTVAA
jgi:hypothetical protein